MRIKLLPSDAEQVAEDILEGDRPPETSDYEVVKYLLIKAKERGIELEFYRLGSPLENIEDGINNPMKSKPLEISMREMQIACDRNIELRPLS